LRFTSNSEGLPCERILGDVKDYGAVKEAVGGKDVVFHFAAVSRVAWGQEDPFNCWLTNQLGTINVLEACRKASSHPMLFYASSREVYGEPVALPVREDHPKNPKSVYGVTKLCAENACRSYLTGVNGGGGVNQVIFRFSNVYGSERDLPERVIPKFMAKAIRGEDITLYGGEQVLDFTFIGDTVSGITKAYSAGLRGEVSGEDFHFVTGTGCSVAELARMIVDQVGSASKIIPISANTFEVRRFIGDPGKAHRMLGYEPRVRLQDGLKILRERMLPVIAAR
jgi:nucleoside-diphosphate-sugar epimerase